MDLKTTQKKELFNKEINSLFKACEEIIELKYNTGLLNSKNQEVKQFLDNYITIYKKTQPEEHFIFFNNLYERIGNDIINNTTDSNGDVNDSWIRKGNIIIQYGENITDNDIRKKCDKIKIQLSTIYCLALDLKSEKEDLINTYELDDKYVGNEKELIYPDILVLHLIRIFYHLQVTDKKKLGDIVTGIEKELGVTNLTVKVESNSLVTTNTTSSGIGNLFNIATNMMKKFGIEPPPGIKPPTDDDVANVFKQVFENETTQKTIGTIFATVKGSNDSQEAINKIIGLKDTETFTTALKDTFNEITTSTNLSSLVSNQSSNPTSPPIPINQPSSP